ncbi:LysR family transcriptional regulator [Sphingomonas alpina]|uniref:LysR family transcriptional regulator n=1 Tax=Sphingomonas alpina TaxID=653931 RepID=A0A7H0LF85_9SPHN|nr:LysR family transcriptional regulator [Sphingomonas alpina]QNQ08338.1 LysR family transcriptional regulator [Sphingomonas alpina]
MDSKKLDLNLLVALDGLLTERNVTHAAARLNLSQPALSAQLARLRDLFGDPLFVPVQRGVLPTPLARDLQQPLREALNRISALISGAHAFDPAEAEISFTIAASDYMQTILLPFLLWVNDTAPGVRIMLRPSGRSAMADLENGEIDIAFLQPSEASGPRLHRLDMLGERYVGVIRKGGLDARPMTLERFIAERHIIVSPRADGFEGPTDEALAALGLTRRVAFAFSSFVFLLDTIIDSDLIALAPERLALRYAELVDRFEPPIAVPGFSIAMVWHDRTHDHPARAWLRERLAEFCADQ